MAERRVHPRYHTAWAIEFGHGEQRWYHAMLHDISLNSFGLSTSHTAVSELATGGRLLLPGDTLSLRSVDGQQWPGNTEPFPCHIRTVRRISQSRYVIGGEFDRLNAVQLAALQHGIGTLTARVAS